MFLLKKIVAVLVLPPASLLLVALLGLWLARRHPRTGHALAGFALATLAILSMPVVSIELLRSVQDSPPVTREELARAQAIVILGGGNYHGAPEYEGDTVNAFTLERLRYGARLARETRLPVAVTGGAPMGGRPEGETMRDSLATDFGITPRWVEGGSRDTAENASMLVPMLKHNGVERIVLVTHAWHMRRARALFADYGLEVIPAPTRFATEPPNNFSRWLPEPNALRNSYQALHEWLGLLALRIARETAQ